MREFARRMKEAVEERMPEKLRTYCILAYYEGMNKDEIALVMDVDVEEVRAMEDQLLDVLGLSFLKE